VGGCDEDMDGNNGQKLDEITCDRGEEIRNWQGPEMY
jgi:hypothetical protein